MTTQRLVLAGAAIVSLLAYADCGAAENAKQNAASQQAAKARDHGNRQDKEGPTDVAESATADAAGLKEGDKTPVLDSPVVDKASKDTGANWKKMDKLLDRF